MTNRAFGRFAHVVGYTCLAGAALDIVGYQGANPGLVLWPTLFALALTLAALVLLDRWRTIVYSVLFLALGGATQFCFMFVTLSQLHTTHSSVTAAFSLVPIALIMVGGPGFVPRSTALWGIAGFAISQVASLAATTLAHASPRFDLVSIAVVAGLVLVEVTIAVTRDRRSNLRAELERAVVDEELSALRYRIEVRAAALIHDMVLNHLSAISNDAEGTLRPGLKRQIEQDLTVMLGDEWLNEPSAEVEGRAQTDWRRSSLFSAVQEARDLSLKIDVTGDLGAVARLSPDRDTAVGLAVKQCLVNVLRHAQIESAEVVIIGSEADVSVMVIDAGRGFSEQLIASDRLGIRQSVRRRIETVGGDVRLWSTPGRGTSVMIRVPAALELATDE